MVISIKVNIMGSIYELSIEYCALDVAVVIVATKTSMVKTDAPKTPSIVGPCEFVH
jgi:hypothetical protein